MNKRTDEPIAGMKGTVIIDEAAFLDDYQGEDPNNLSDIKLLLKYQASAIALSAGQAREAIVTGAGHWRGEGAAHLVQA